MCHLCDEEYFHDHRRLVGTLLLAFLGLLTGSVLVVRTWLDMGLAVLVFGVLAVGSAMLLKRHRQRFVESSRAPGPGLCAQARPRLPLHRVSSVERLSF